jgi:hypothetical protein
MNLLLAPLKGSSPLVVSFDETIYGLAELLG